MYLCYVLYIYTNHFVCTCFFVDVYHERFVHLETYTYERGHSFKLVSYFFWVTLFIFGSLVASKRKYLVSACLTFICFFVHSYFIEDLWLHAYYGEHVDLYCLNVLTSFWPFQLVLVSNWYPWACEHFVLKRSSLYLGWASLMLNLLIWYLLMAQPYLWCKCYVLCAMFWFTHSCTCCMF